MKKSIEGDETNEFDLVANTSNNYIDCEINVTKATSPLDDTKILSELEIKIKQGSKYDASCELKSYTLNILAGSVQVTNPAISLTEAQMDTIRAGGTVTISDSYEFANDGASDSRNWSATTNCEILITTTTTTKTGVPGSVEGTKYASGSAAFYGQTWYVQFDANAVAHLGSASNGSDSYWTVTVTPKIYAGNYGSITAPSRAMGAYIDGTDVGGSETGSMNKGTGYSTTWTGRSVSRRIPYASGKTSATINAYVDFNLSIGSTYVGRASTGNVNISLPRITLNTEQTTTTTSTSTVADSGRGTYLETLSNNENNSNVSYENNAETSARLACYYATKAVTVYGYENDRRIFLTNGSNSDTFSGDPKDDNYSTITYFPDTNYNVLGEDANILGYAQKAGFLFTVKEGGDSLYVRKGASVDNDLFSLLYLLNVIYKYYVNQLRLKEMYLL